MLPKEVGMLLEIKYPSPDMQDRLPLPFPDRNVFLNIILDDLLASANTRDRNIAFLCFEPDICKMVALKQNAFPVYLSHCQTLDKPCDEFDPRRIDLLTGFDFVKSNQLDGIMILNKLIDIRGDAMEKILKDKVPILTYGKSNCDAAFVQKQFEMGVDGVIADDVPTLVKDLAATDYDSSSATATDEGR